IKIPPRPQGLPFIGNVHQFDFSKPQVLLWELSKIYGPFISLHLGVVPIIVVSSAEMAKESLKTHDIQFCSRLAKIRKLCVSHLFNPSRAQSFRPIREDEVSRMIEYISKSAASKQVNLSGIMMSLASNIICRIGFGKRHGNEYEAISGRSRFLTFFTEIQASPVGFFVTDYFPFMGWIDKLRGMMRRLEIYFQKADTFYQELNDEHKDPNITKAELQQEDIVDVLLQVQKDHGFKVDLTLDHIYKHTHICAICFANGSTVVWAMTYLMKHPRAMKKVQEEIRSLIGCKGFVDEVDLQEVKYLKAVLKGTLRLQSPIPLLVPKEIMEKCLIDGYEIRAKTLVYVKAWAIRRDPEAWENPEEFNPERFIDCSIDYKEQNLEFIPF
ncbi:hypothetical protein CISIN_1g046023mg, partial [Citrus sinensis]